MSNQKTHWKKLFNYDYMGCYSLDDYDSEPILTIKSIELKEITNTGGKKETCPVVEWKEKEKPFILNKTNAKILTTVYGTPYKEDWIGKRVQLYSKSGVRSVDGGTTDGLRIRDFIPKSTAEADKTKLQKEIRVALASYKGDDLADLKQTLREKVEAKEDTIRFYQSILEHIKAPAV